MELWVDTNVSEKEELLSPSAGLKMEEVCSCDTSTLTTSSRNITTQRTIWTETENVWEENAKKDIWSGKKSLIMD